ncbi:MAG: ribbon-helix-helix domain-containing protein [Thermomicrobiales bacterium]
MALMLPPNLARQVRQFVDCGDYADAEDVLSHALELLANEQKFYRIKAAIDATDADIAAGRLFESTPEFWQGIKEGSATMLNGGEKLDRDVCPE